MFVRNSRFIQYIVSYFIIAKSPFVYISGNYRPLAAPRSFLLPCPKILQLFTAVEISAKTVILCSLVVNSILELKTTIIETVIFWLYYKTIFSH